MMSASEILIVLGLGLMAGFAVGWELRAWLKMPFVVSRTSERQIERRPQREENSVTEFEWNMEPRKRKSGLFGLALIIGVATGCWVLWRRTNEKRY